MATPLDPADDPDRFDPDRPGGGAEGAGAGQGGPPRYGGSGTGQTLPGLLGDGAQEEAREPRTWLLGLAMVIGFLLLVSLLVQLGH